MDASTETLSSIEVLPARGGRRRWPDITQGFPSSRGRGLQQSHR